MATRADEMSSLVEGLIDSAHKRVDAALQRAENELARAAKGTADARDRAVEFSTRKTNVDGFLQDLQDGRIRRTTEDSTQRARTEAERRSSTAEFMNSVSMSVAGLRLDVSEMLASLLDNRTTTAAADHNARAEAEQSRRAEAEVASESRRDEFAQRSADVADELENLAGDRGLAKQLWAEGVQAVHAVVAGPAKVAAEQAAAAKAAAEHAAAEKAAAERAAAEKAAAEKVAAVKAAADRAAEEKAARKAASGNE